jgi:catechol 2,3-dioxygenase-like lactoylglutathione lyase family enzyme
MSDRAEPGLGELTYLYVATDDVARNLGFYERALGARLVWRFAAFATEVAAVRLGPGPLVLLAGHRDAPGVLPIWTVADLDAAVARLRSSGFEVEGETAGTPDGPVHVLRDPSGNQLGCSRPTAPTRSSRPTPTPRTPTRSTDQPVLAAARI